MRRGGGGRQPQDVQVMMLVRYCNANCQRNHWPKHKKDCKRRAAELRDEALFKEPPPKEDCPICFLPMPIYLISCASLPPATMSSLPIHDYANEHEELVKKCADEYYSCCGKNIYGGCMYSFSKSGRSGTCPFCNSNRDEKTDDEQIDDLMKRVEANDAGATYVLGSYHCHGSGSLQQDSDRAIELWTQAAKLGSRQAHHNLGSIYYEGGDVKTAKFHYEAAAMDGHETARFNLGCMEYKSGKVERAVKHWNIAASAGNYKAMNTLIKFFEIGDVSRESIDSTLMAYNSSCAEFRSEARDACIRAML